MRLLSMICILKPQHPLRLLILFSLGLIVSLSGFSAVVIEASQCQELDQQLSEFTNPSCAQKVNPGWLSNHQCAYDIKDCVPEVFRQLHSRKSQINGLNCWNASLFAAQIAPVLRYTPPAEFTYFIESPLCRELLAHEPRSLMDIIAIRGPNEQEVHAYSYLSSKLVFSKNGSEIRDLYLVQLLEPVLKQYKVTAALTHQKAFHCQSFKRFLDQSRAQYPDLVQAHEYITEIENTVAMTAPLKVHVSRRQGEQIQELIKKAAALGRSSQLPGDENENFLRRGIAVRLLGIAEHLNDESKKANSDEVAVRRPIIETITASLKAASIK